jgi:hypothetical protein
VKHQGIIIRPKFNHLTGIKFVENPKNGIGLIIGRFYHKTDITFVGFQKETSVGHAQMAYRGLTAQQDNHFNNTICDGCFGICVKKSKPIISGIENLKGNKKNHQNKNYQARYKDEIKIRVF